MYKYRNVNKLVMQLTDDEALRTFFTIYLMCENEEERSKIDETFMGEIELLEDAEKVIIKEKLKQSLLNLPKLLNQLEQNVNVILEKQKMSKAA
jgi:hypothetical protein